MATDSSFAPLPVGSTVKETPILFGPEHTDFPLETLPPGAPLALLGKDATEGWLRVKEGLTGRNLVGWIPATTTDLSAAQTGVVASPPRCAAPRAYLETDSLAPVVDWTSDVYGHVVLVIDLFRDQAGPPPTVGQLILTLNSQDLSALPLNATQHSFLFRGMAIDVTAKPGDKLQLFLSEAALPGTMLHLRVSVFFVPNGCSF